jgi:hypothetical protein
MSINPAKSYSGFVALILKEFPIWGRFITFIFRDEYYPWTGIVGF